MNFIKTLIAMAALVFSVLANAANDVHHAKYGGVVQEIGHIQYELVVKQDSIAIFVEDHGKKIDTKGGTTKVTLLTGSEKTDATLTAAGENKLEAKGSFKAAKGTKAVAVVQLAGKTAIAARFVLP
jgi:hypothetical protein